MDQGYYGYGPYAEKMDTVWQMRSKELNDNFWVSRLWEQLSSNVGDPPSSIQALIQSNIASFQVRGLWLLHLIVSFLENFI